MTSKKKPTVRTMAFVIHNPQRTGDTPLSKNEREALRSPRIKGAVPTRLKTFYAGTGQRHKEMAAVLDNSPGVVRTSMLGTGLSYRMLESPAELTSTLAAPISKLIYENDDEGYTALVMDLSSIVAISGDMAHLRNRLPFIALFEVIHSTDVIHAVREVVLIST